MNYENLKTNNIQIWEIIEKDIKKTYMAKENLLGAKDEPGYERQRSKFNEKLSKYSQSNKKYKSKLQRCQSTANYN